MNSAFCVSFFHRYGEHKVRICGSEGHHTAIESTRVQPSLICQSFHKVYSRGR